MKQEASYLDIQAEVGITKHIGGFGATDTLLELCHLKGRMASAVA